MKKIYNHYLDKRKEIMKKTQFKFENVFGDAKSKDGFSQEQKTKPNNFLARIINFYFFKPRRIKNIDIEPSFPPYYD